MTVPKGLAARALIETNKGKSKMYIEIREGNRFSNFYYTYTAVGRGRHRVVTPGTSRHRGFANSLEGVIEKIVKAIKAHAQQNKTELQVHTTIRVYRKRLYRKLLNMRPDELGLTHVAYQPDPRLMRAELTTPQNNRLPVTYATLAKRWQIITNRR